MSYPISTVPAVLTYLFSTLNSVFLADANPDSIYLSLGDPGEQAPSDIVEITGVNRTTPHFAMVGDGQQDALEEVYQVIVKISSAQRGDTQATISPVVMARAWALLADVETAVRKDPTLGGNVFAGWPGRTTGGVPVWSPNGNGMICEIELTIDVEMTF